MASVKSSSSFVTVTLRSKAISVNFDSDAIHTLECDLKLPAEKAVNKGSSNLDETVFLPCSDVSLCNQWFVFSVKKCLLLWKTQDWSLVSTCKLHRSPSKVKFSPDGSKIIVADKGGDVFMFFRDNLLQPGSLLFGHLSLLFDVIITNDEKFIISCDRDEKIRVSCFPNAYHINTFCLGHEEFVTCVNILPHCQSVLMSTSGDGSLRLWDFKEGKEILKYQCSDDISEIYCEPDSPIVDDVPIIKCESFQISKSESIVCVLFNNCKGCVVYTITGLNHDLSICKLQNTSFSDIICDICISDDILWLVSSYKKFKLFGMQWNKLSKHFEPNIKNEKICKTVINVNNSLSKLDCNFVSKLSLLYKKQYDDVADYKRKNDNLHESSKKNKTKD